MNGDIIFPSDNSLGIPSLWLLLAQPRVELPLRAWGSSSRKREAPGGWHFYVDDYRFARLLKSPATIEDSSPRYCCELNISITNQMPPVVAHYWIYRKRWIARYWQEIGIPIVVDLNVAPQYERANLLGVPEGWPVFSTRGHEATLAAHRAIASQVNPESTLIVIGGGKKVRQLTTELPNCVYLESF